MKCLSAFMVLAFVSVAPAQDLLGRIATLEQNNAAILSRMASVESKIDSLAAKVDKLAENSQLRPMVAVGATVLETAPVAYLSNASACSGNTTTYTLTSGACGSSAASDACGSASGASNGTPFMQRGPIRRFLGRFRGAGGCGG